MTEVASGGVAKLAPHEILWCMTSDKGKGKRRKAERRDEMTRFGARLPQARAEAVQRRLDADRGVSQQQVGEYLFAAYGYGLIDVFDLMRQVHEHERRIRLGGG